MTEAPLLVLDFDGVICDSIDECFLSSWTAYHRLHLGSAGSCPDPGAREGFARLRPFVRAGEDFVLIQEILARGLGPADQAAFDRLAQDGGNAARYRGLFYQAREDHLRRDRQGWLALNRVYPHVKAAFVRLPAGAPCFVLSTKKPPFIAEIMAANGIAIPGERIVWSDGEPKLVTVGRLLDAAGRREAVFVEDQVDAIAGNTDSRIRVYLATWGYVKPEWLQRDDAGRSRAWGVPLLTPPAFGELVERELVGR